MFEPCWIVGQIRLSNPTLARAKHKRGSIRLKRCNIHDVFAAEKKSLRIFDHGMQGGMLVELISEMGSQR